MPEVDSRTVSSFQFRGWAWINAFFALDVIGNRVFRNFYFLAVQLPRLECLGLSWKGKNQRDKEAQRSLSCVEIPENVEFRIPKSDLLCHRFPGRSEKARGMSKCEFRIPNLCHLGLGVSEETKGFFGHSGRFR